MMPVGGVAGPRAVPAGPESPVTGEAVHPFVLNNGKIQFLSDGCGE